MNDPKHPASELTAEKELEKIELEIKELRDNRSRFSKLAKITLPLIAGLTAICTGKGSVAGEPSHVWFVLNCL